MAENKKIENKEYVGVENNIIMEVISDLSQKNAAYDYYEITSVSDIFNECKIYCRDSEDEFDDDNLSAEDWATVKAYGIKLYNVEHGDNDQAPCHAYAIEPIIGTKNVDVKDLKKKLIENLQLCITACKNECRKNVGNTQEQGGEYVETLIHNLQIAYEENVKIFYNAIQIIDSEFIIEEVKV